MSFLLRKIFKLIKNTFLVVSALSVIITLMNITAYTVLFYDTNINLACNKLFNDKNFCDFFGLIYKSSSIFIVFGINAFGLILFIFNLVKGKIDNFYSLGKIETLTNKQTVFEGLNKNITIPLRI